MSRYSKFNKVAKNGAVDSKYFGNLNKFEKDVIEKIEATEDFKLKIRNLILDDPQKIEQRFHNAISVLKEIKEEFKI